ncbi:MAG TPA: acetyl-CoA carboxylase, carboxyltransferase subunit beta [Thermoanaerobaculia bacterium]|nr:acetyl-CoA carboxylase, carboxyltransferase subunit beta [Thermoanaerobaculia bacterium]
MWFKKDKAPKEPRQNRPSKVPEGLWVKCTSCREIIYAKELQRYVKICPRCGYHFPLSATERLRSLFDGEAFTVVESELRSGDPLHFKDSKRYRDRLRQYEESVGTEDAAIVARGTVGGLPAVIVAMEFGFMGGSMGSVVGEKIARAAERCVRERAALVIVCTSGGARMQEGILSLMQMAKTSAALARLAEARLPYIAILTDPTTGGVTASYAMQGDMTIAEPKALIGFAGPRVIEQTIRQTLPPGFQRAEFLLEHGMVDMVVERKDLKETVGRCLRLLMA